MLIKKLLVPFINEKILQNAEHCSIAAAAISEPAFDFLMSKLPPKCKVDIVTGLDRPTHPNVLSKVLRQYPNRIRFKIYSQNFFHPNVYLFDLPYRKMVAFVGSADFTMGGFRDNETLSYKIDTEKGVEEVKTWFRSYFDYAEELTDTLVAHYQDVYFSILAREAESRRETRALLDASTSSFRWETAKLVDQYFQEEDYATFAYRKASLDTQLIRFERERVLDKLLHLQEQLQPIVKKLGLQTSPDGGVSGLAPTAHTEHKIKAMCLAYWLEGTSSQLQMVVSRQEVGIWIDSSVHLSGKEENVGFKNNLGKVEYRKKFFELLKGLGVGYWIEMAGEKRAVSFFKTAEQLTECIVQAEFLLRIGTSYAPNHSDISASQIVNTIQQVFTKLLPLYKEVEGK